MTHMWSFSWTYCWRPKTTISKI